MPGPTIYQDSVRTRAKTLQEHSGAHQNGSTRVRSEGQPTADLQAGEQDSAAEDDFDNNYFDELTSPDLGQPKGSSSTVFDSDQEDASALSPRPSSPAERLFGDGQQPQEMMRDSKGQMADAIKTHVTLEDPSPRMTPAQNKPSVIKPTRHAPVKNFAEYGQTEERGDLKVEQAMGETESEVDKVTR